MSNLRVLIVGASIAGPTAAYWFAKTGAKVTVIERFPQLRTNGQNIDIRTAGVSVMRKMPGMEEAVRAALQPIDGISLVDTNGHPYGTMTSTGDPDQQSLISEYEILRGDLSRIIVDLSKGYKNVNYIFGEQVASIQHNEKSDGPIQVDFMNGTPSWISISLSLVTAQHQEPGHLDSDVACVTTSNLSIPGLLISLSKRTFSTGASCAMHIAPPAGARLPLALTPVAAIVSR